MKDQGARKPGELGHSLENSQDEREIRALVKEAFSGSRDAYRAALRRMESMLRPFVRNMLAQASHSHGVADEDLIQEILLGIHRKRDTYDVNQPFLPWMYSIARYKTIDYLRTVWVRKGTTSLDDPDSELPDPAAPGENPGDRLDVHAILARLPGKQRELIRLVKIEGLSVQEASLRTGFSPSDVRVSVHRGLKVLRKLLAEGDPDENG